MLAGHGDPKSTSRWIAAVQCEAVGETAKSDGDESIEDFTITWLSQSSVLQLSTLADQLPKSDDSIG
jgi:hypothetical protein